MPTTLEWMQQRHSVRQYTDAPIPQELRQQLDEIIRECCREPGIRIQAFYDEPQCFRSLLAHYGRIRGVKNYIALVGTKDPQTEVRLGYLGEKIVLEAQKLGLNTCWAAVTHGKSQAEIGKGEKEYCLIALGYGANAGTPHKSKSFPQVCPNTGTLPQWFTTGVEAALLAPTAINQQKFTIELLPDEQVRLTCGKGPCIRLDQGIIQYHFETATGRKITCR